MRVQSIIFYAIAPHLQPNNNLLTLVKESNFEDNLRSQTDFSLHSVHTVA